MAWGGGGIQCTENCDLVLEGSILWGNCAQDEGDQAKLLDAASSLTFSCCDVDSSGIVGDGSVVWLTDNLSVDPGFCDPGSCNDAPTIFGDYRLQADSPCLDAPGCSLIGSMAEGCGGTHVAESASVTPASFELGNAVPNPFNPSATISYSIPFEVEERRDGLTSTSGLGSHEDSQSAHEVGTTGGSASPRDPGSEVDLASRGPGARRVQLKIYDLTGRLVRTLVDEPQTGGVYTATWNGTNNAGTPVATGVYFYRLTWNGLSATNRVVLLK
jgi:hypothetical protein